LERHKRGDKSEHQKVKRKRETDETLQSKKKESKVTDFSKVRKIIL